MRWQGWFQISEKIGAGRRRRHVPGREWILPGEGGMVELLPKIQKTRSRERRKKEGIMKTSEITSRNVARDDELFQPRNLACVDDTFHL